MSLTKISISQVTAALVALFVVAFAGQALASKSVFVDDGYAIRGYDPVAYFTEGKPVEGKQEFKAEYDGATWLFASAANRDKFKADPVAFAPQYGGFCAYAVSQGYTAKIEPDAWKIVDGKLYLNYDKRVQGIWEKDIPGYIAEADKNWPELAGN